MLKAHCSSEDKEVLQQHPLLALSTSSTQCHCSCTTQPPPNLNTGNKKTTTCISIISVPAAQDELREEHTGDAARVSYLEREHMTCSNGIERTLRVPSVSRRAKISFSCQEKCEIPYDHGLRRRWGDIPVKPMGNMRENHRPWSTKAIGMMAARVTRLARIRTASAAAQLMPIGGPMPTGLWKGGRSRRKKDGQTCNGAELWKGPESIKVRVRYNLCGYGKDTLATYPAVRVIFGFNGWGVALWMIT
ncbi:hypothetical protein DNTS_005500 [Danionella cerebrum]|uniref:Uncharacterized protein n=1 Tax=Danionella cerebrum TaxID=2873325 RepID=A0A553PYI5_9TELE|nr:hypothetical protein DNTS_005500 [Danionella translucida]